MIIFLIAHDKEQDLSLAEKMERSTHVQSNAELDTNRNWLFFSRPLRINAFSDARVSPF